MPQSWQQSALNKIPLNFSLYSNVQNEEMQTLLWYLSELHIISNSSTTDCIRGIYSISRMFKITDGCVINRCSTEYKKLFSIFTKTLSENSPIQEIVTEILSKHHICLRVNNPLFFSGFKEFWMLYCYIGKYSNSS